MNLYPFSRRLPIMILAMATILCLALGVLAQQSLKTKTEALVQARFETQAYNSARELQTWFSSVSEDLGVVSSDPKIDQYFSGMEQYFQQRRQTVTQSLQSRYIERNPFPVGERQKLHLPPNPDQYDQNHDPLNRMLSALVDIKGYYDVFIISADGDVVYSVFKETDFATNLLDGQAAEEGLSQVFIQARAKEPGDISFQNFAPYSPSAGAAAAFMATRIDLGRGKGDPVLAFQLSTDRLTSALSVPAQFGDGRIAYLVNASGQLSSSVFGSDAFQLLDELPRTDAVTTAMRGEEGFLDKGVGLSGETVTAVSAGFQANGTRLGLVIEASRAHQYKELTAVRQNLTLASLAILAVAGLVGYLLSRLVTTPLASLRDAMETIAQGNYQVTVQGTDRKDEFGAIARVLDGFVSKLRDVRKVEEERAKKTEEQAAVVEILSTGLKKLREGDLSFSITEALGDDYDRLRMDYNSSVETLNHALAQVVDSAESIRNGAQEIAQASDDLSNRTENQAATLEQTAAALDELTASVKSAADGAKSVEDIVSQAKEEATQSGHVVKSAVEAMNKIENSSEQISQIIGVIDDIAFQTNLLALNAGVEASRAGESGKGFSVVASEVRALAQRSSEAAHEIKALISGSTHQVEQGVDMVGKAGNALESIVARVNHISQLVSEIASGASEQSAGLGEINVGVNQLDQVTQQNAAMVEEATAASHILQKDTTVLVDLVAGFTIKTERHATPDPEEDSSEDDALVYDQEIQISAQKMAPPAPPPARAAGGQDLGWQDF